MPGLQTGGLGLVCCSMSQRFELIKMRGPEQDDLFQEWLADIDQGPALGLVSLFEIFDDAAARWPDELVAGVFYSETDDWLLMVAKGGNAIDTSRCRLKRATGGPLE